jgi:hypothetical protein
LTFLIFELSPQVTKTLAWRIYIVSEEIIVRFGPATILAILNFLIIIRFLQITARRREMFASSGASGIVADFTTDAAGGGGGNSQLLLRGERISKKIYKEEKRLVTLLTAIVLLFFVTTVRLEFTFGGKV